MLYFPNLINIHLNHCSKCVEFTKQSKFNYVKGIWYVVGWPPFVHHTNYTFYRFIRSHLICTVLITSNILSWKHIIHSVICIILYSYVFLWKFTMNIYILLSLYLYFFFSVKLFWIYRILQLGSIKNILFR